MVGPINFLVAKVARIGKQPVQFGVGARYWAELPESDPTAGAPAPW